MQKPNDYDEGCDRQVHQMVYNYLPGKILAYSPSIYGEKHSSFVNAKVIYDRLQQTSPTLNKGFDTEVGQNIRSLLPKYASKAGFVFHELDSSISPSLEIFPRLLEVSLPNGEKMLYWLRSDCPDTPHSGSAENLVKILGKEKIRGMFFCDLVFCDRKNWSGRFDPIFELAIPPFMKRDSKALILGDENWNNRKIRITLANESIVDIDPRAEYPQTYGSYLADGVRDWRTFPKKARGRDTYVPKIFHEVFYDISGLQKEIKPRYILEWLHYNYPESDDPDSVIRSEDWMQIEKNIHLIVDENIVEKTKTDDFKRGMLETTLKRLKISDTLDTVHGKAVEWKNNVEFLRLMSIRKSMDCLTPEQLREGNRLPGWLGTIDENVAKNILSCLDTRNIVRIGPSNRIRVVDFIYGWFSGSYDDDNFMFKMPVFSKKDEWPVLYYQFNSEGMLLEFDNAKLCEALSSLGLETVPNKENFKEIFLHTVAHFMIKSLPVYCGIDANQLGERIYHDGNSASIMIFSKEPGEVKLGGIKDTLERHLSDWIKSWDSLIECSLEGDEQDGCHYCTYLANGCVEFNKKLSRKTVDKVFSYFASHGGV